MKVSHRITRLAIVGLTVVALAAPVASAAPGPDRHAGPVGRARAARRAERRRGLRLGLRRHRRRRRRRPHPADRVGGTTYRHRHEHIGVAR